MKLASLINLESLQEIDFNDPALMRARAAKDKMNQMKSNPRISYDQALDLRIVKRDLEKKIKNKFKEMQNDPNIEPEGGPVADDYGDQLNRLEDRLYKIDKQIASYDMSERTDAISTARALPNDRDEEDERNDQNLAQDDTRFEFNMREDKELDKNQQSIAAKWDKESKKLEGGLFDTSRELEKTDTKQFNINVNNKLEFLTDLNNAGKFRKKGGYSDDQIENWTINPSVTGYDIASKMKPTTNEGSCGHGPNGVPGNTPGETKGMPADDRTRGMLKMLIQKEIAKYENK